jgi:hypothetical protein
MADPRLSIYKWRDDEWSWEYEDHKTGFVQASGLETTVSGAACSAEAWWRQSIAAER